jgi:predicted 2-oxoglutarate/Fe(II)-dependent dioxygenase YbiX
MSTTKSKPFNLNNKEILNGLEKIARRDAVNHPSHYNSGNIEVIDAIEDWGLDFNAGNVVKYVARHQHKANPVEDLKKARWYLDRIIERIEKCQ